ncbi:MAG: citrate/2-methylcitrate synthase, partial [bacterium]
MLHKVLSEKIPQWQDEIRKVIQDRGDAKVGDVTVSQLYGGMRGIKGLTCETSAVSADKGLIIRGNPLLDITHISPEEVFYLLLTGDLPDDGQLSDLQDQLKTHQNVPDYIWKILEAMPENSHPMTMLTVAIQSMQVDSLFSSKYDEGIPKTDYWKWTLEDGIRLVAKVTGIAAGIYRHRFNKGDRIAPDNNLDWSGNYAHMLGIEGDDFKKLMR